MSHQCTSDRIPDAIHLSAFRALSDSMQAFVLKHLKRENARLKAEIARLTGGAE